MIYNLNGSLLVKIPSVKSVIPTIVFLAEKVKLTLVSGDYFSVGRKGMNKREFIESISESNQMTQAAARKALNTLLATMMETMKDGEKVTISGFGSFRVVAKAAQKGRNPQTGQPIVIPARRVVKFKPAKKLTEKMS